MHSVINFLAEIFQAIDPHLGVFILSVLPIIELRGAIPVGLLVYKLPLIEVILVGAFGNILTSIIVLKWLEPIRDFFTSRIKWMERFYEYVIDKTQRKHSAKFKAVGAIFLVSFVAIPVPGSGAWTGCLIAYLYDVPYKRAIGLISTGIIISAFIITALTTGSDAVIRALYLIFTG